MFVLLLLLNPPLNLDYINPHQIAIFPLLTLLAVKNSLQFVVEFYFQLSFLFVSFRFFFLYFFWVDVAIRILLCFAWLPCLADEKKKRGTFVFFFCYTKNNLRYARPTHSPTHPTNSQKLFFYRDRRTTQKLVFPFHSKLTSPRTHQNLAFVFFLSACKFIHVSPHSPLFFFFLPYIQNG